MVHIKLNLGLFAQVGGHFSEIPEATESASANLMKPSSIQSRYTVPDPNAGGASKKKSSLAASISVWLIAFAKFARLIHFSKFVSIMSSSELLPTNGIN
jgi:hypothetical protein